MQERTYESLPIDVLTHLPREFVTMDPSIPFGYVDVFSQSRPVRMSANAFARVRRKARKAERRNRKAGRS